MTRRSYGARLRDASVQSSHHVPVPMAWMGEVVGIAYPETSLTISRTKAVRLLK